MGICQPERLDVNNNKIKEQIYKKIPRIKKNQIKLKESNNTLNNKSSLNSTSINNVLFNNTKRNSSSNYKFKNISPKKNLFINNELKNISFNNNYQTNTQRVFFPKNKNNSSSSPKPTSLRKIPSPIQSKLIEEKYPIDNFRSKKKNLDENKEKKNMTNRNEIKFSPNRIINSNSFNNFKPKCINILSEKPQYINQKIIKDDDDTDKILLNLNKEIKIKSKKKIDNTLILSFDEDENQNEDDIELYYLNEFNFNSNSKYSSSKDFDDLIQSEIFKNKINFTNLLLFLPERKWYKELIELSELIKLNRQKQNIDPLIFNDCLNKFIKIYNHFNHLVWALSYFYFNSLFYNKSTCFKNDKLNLPLHNSLEWIKGFEWKGLHIKVLTYEQSKKLIHEIKALNYILYDYFQLFNNNKINNKKNLISNEIIFPLMSYAYVGGIILYVSVEIKKFFYDENFLMSNVNSKEENKLEKMRKSLIRQSIRLSIKYDNYNYENINEFDDDDIDDISFDEYILNKEINLSNYSKEDLNNSKILYKINENNLLKIFDDRNDNMNEKIFKFILINIYSLLPKLFKEDDKTIYTRMNQINCIDIKNEFETPRYINLTKINNLDKNNEMEILSKLIRIKATKENIAIYKSKIDNIHYKIIYDNNNKGNKINEQVTKYFVQFPLIQNPDLSRLLTTEYLNVGNLNLILNKYYIEHTEEIPDRNIIIYRTSFQTKMKYSLITSNKEQIFPKNIEEYKTYFKNVCEEMSIYANKIRNVDNLYEYCEKFGLNKKFLPFCLEFIEDEYLRNLIQIYLYTCFIKKMYNYNEGQTLLMKLAIFERNKDENIINSSDFIKDNNIVEIQKQSIVDLIKLIFLPVELLKDSGPHESFSKKFFQNISFFIFLKMLKIKNYEKLINFKSKLCQLEIKQIIMQFNEITRKNPFLFIDSLEKLLNIRISPFVKYRASIDINNLKSLNKDNIVIFYPNIKSFVNISTLTSYIFTDFAKGIALSNNIEKKLKLEQILSNIELDNFYPNLIFKNPISYDKNNNLIFKNNHYYIYSNEIMKKFCYILEYIYDGIISYNGEKELMLFKTYLYLLLTAIFYHNDLNESKEILIKMKEIIKNQCLFSFTEYAVLNLLKAFININNISYNEELYSIVFFLTLLNEGDIKNKMVKGKIHPFLMFPLFQLCLINAFHNNNNYLKEYLKEFYFILNKIIKNNVEIDKKNNKSNLGYYTFPYENSFLSPNDNKINKEYLNDINFKCFICKVIIDYFYSINHLLYDDDFLLYYKIIIKEENEKEDNQILFNNNTNNSKKQEPYNVFNKYIIEYLLDEMSYQKYAPSNIVISFGNNNYNQTSHENLNIIMTPRIIYSLLNKKIKKIFSGYDYNFVIDENNKIYSWGLNSDGQCGNNDKKIITCITEIEIEDLEKEEKIIHIKCGKNSTFFISNEDKIYHCGYNLTTKEKITKPKKIKFFFEKEKIIQIEIGEKFWLFLTALGNVYIYNDEGENDQIKKGKKDNNDNNNEPKEVIRNIQLISCGYNHYFALDKNNVLFGFGENNKGQLGLDDNNVNKSIIIPKRIVLNNEIDNIFCGKDYTIFHTNKKEILVCGKNEEGELGIGKEVYSKDLNNNNCIKPKKIEQFFNLEIIKVSCGENNCVAMVRDSTTKIVNVWSWGSNKKGQLGLGSNIENSKPKLIPALLEYINHLPIDVTCGKNHCLVLLKKKDEINIDNNKILNDLITKYNKF